MDFRGKILTSQTLQSWRRELASVQKKLVVTNGCFDLLHLGHVSYLEDARNHGDALLVGVNGDQGVRSLKGPKRPVNSEADRAGVVAALQAVDGVYVFPEQTATNFLRQSRPDIYAKGGDYNLETMNQEERKLLQEIGAQIVFIPFIPGKSTTALIAKFAST